MTVHLDALGFDALDPAALARFWGDLLGWETADDPRAGIELVPNDDTGFRFRFLPTEAPKVGLDQIHLHLTSASEGDQPATVARVLELGGRHLDVGQLPEEDHVVLADPEGNELCVIPAGNSFLAGTGFLGELACDGTQAVGYFWSAALGWPLNWDQHEETSIRSPHGGPKVSWGGPPLNPRTGKNRHHFDLVPADGDQQAEVERLISLGATRADTAHAEPGWVGMADPDGNEFCVMSPE